MDQRVGRFMNVRIYVGTTGPSSGETKTTQLYHSIIHTVLQFQNSEYVIPYKIEYDMMVQIFTDDDLF